MNTKTLVGILLAGGGLFTTMVGIAFTIIMSENQVFMIIGGLALTWLGIMLMHKEG